MVDVLKILIVYLVKLVLIVYAKTLVLVEIMQFVISINIDQRVVVLIDILEILQFNVIEVNFFLMFKKVSIFLTDIHDNNLIMQVTNIISLSNEIIYIIYS